MTMTRKWIRRCRWLLLVAGVLFLGLEMYARFSLGLGDPPLSMADPEIEYLFKPNQRCHRFGNFIQYNAFSMRNQDLTASKPSNSVRVLMFGDSVLNGGAQTDQRDLATTIASGTLSQALQKPVVVCHISAGSWGPPNCAAYRKRYGLFGADMVGLVVSAHDAWDVPTFAPLVGIHPGFPGRKPLSAVMEGFSRYLLPRIQSRLYARQRDPEQSDPMSVPGDKARQWVEVRTAVRQLLQDGTNAPASRFLIFHRTQSDWRTGKIDAGETLFREEAAKESVPLFLLELDPETDYRDNIHINPTGQRKLATLTHRIVANGCARGTAQD